MGQIAFQGTDTSCRLPTGNRGACYPSSRSDLSPRVPVYFVTQATGLYPGSENLSALTVSDINRVATNVTVQAVLCWSEYYNGKWQTAKTSDIDAPTELGSFPPTGNKMFDRSELRLDFAKAGDALGVSIAYRTTGKGSSFLFYNTHSLPVARAPEPPSTPGTDTLFDRDVAIRDSDQHLYLTITYHDQSPHLPADRLDLTLFETLIPGLIIEPSGQSNTSPAVWDAPFFFEDSRHLFYVTTEGPLSGMISPPAPAAFGTSARQPQPNPAVALSPALRRGPRVGGDALVPAIGARGGVRYGGRELGPQSGARGPARRR
jgi:hypothetical protein